MYIYKITNLINNKIYIGLKCKPVEESTEYYGSGTVLAAAIKKHGRENFIKEILERDIEDYDLLCEREVYWIKYYNSNNGRIGYNRTIGGNGVRGYEITNEDREARSKLSSGRSWYHDPKTNKNVFVKYKPVGYLEGRYLSDDARLRMSNARKGITVDFTKEHRENLSKAISGKPLSSEHKKKISNAKIGSTLSDQHKNNISKSLSGGTKNYKVRTCPHCGLTSRGANMTRYHFDNCNKLAK
jgi:group I intron endonuclease